MKNKILIIAAILLLVCCSGGENKNVAGQTLTSIKNKQKTSYSITRNDSLLILKLVRKVYEWNEKNSSYYFDIGIEDQAGDKYVGINWEIYEENKNLLKSSGFFSNIFIESYKKTLEHIDKKVKNKEYDYEWFTGEYPPFGTDLNEWCHCQDTPSENYWDKIEIKNLKVTGNNTASLIWTWGETSKWNSDFKYRVKVKKEDNTWKVTYLDGFDKKYYL